MLRALVVLIAALAAASPASAEDALVVDFLPVGAGNCIVVSCPGGREALLVDCGTQRGPAGRGTDAPGLLADRVAERLGAFSSLQVVVTHAHPDHVDLLQPIRRRLPPSVDVTAVWVGGRPEPREDEAGPGAWDPPPPRYAQFDRRQEPTASSLAREATPVWGFGAFHSDRQAPSLRCGGDQGTAPAQGWILAVNAEHRPLARACPATATRPRVNPDPKNLRSLVLLLSWGDAWLLLPGDSECGTEAAALETLAALQAAGRIAERDRVSLLMAAPHHGSVTAGSNSVEWAEATRPDAIVYSAGLSAGHPRCEVAARYRPALPPAAPHPFECGLGDLPVPVRVESSLAEYTTLRSGHVRARTEGGAWRIEPGLP